MLLRPIVLHFALVTVLLPAAAVCALLDRADAARERVRPMKVGPCF